MCVHTKPFDEPSKNKTRKEREKGGTANPQTLSWLYYYPDIIYALAARISPQPEQPVEHGNEVSQHGQTLRYHFIGRIDFYHTQMGWGGGNAKEKDCDSNLAEVA